jgi:hypothetical protein
MVTVTVTVTVTVMIIKVTVAPLVMNMVSRGEGGYAKATTICHEKLNVFTPAIDHGHDHGHGHEHNKSTKGERDDGMPPIDPNIEAKSSFA